MSQTCQQATSFDHADQASNPNGLFQGTSGGVGYLPILVGKHARDAYRTNKLAIDENWHATVVRSSSAQSENSQPDSTSGDGILERLGRAAKQHRRARLVFGAGALLIVLLQGVAVQAADIKVLCACAARQPQRRLHGTHYVLKFAPQSTRGEGRVLHVGGTRGSTLVVRVEDVVLRLHGHMARVSAV